MWKFVTVSKRMPVGLPDPAKASTPEKAARMEAVNKVIIEETEDKNDTVVTRRGVKRKRMNNNYSPETRAKIARYASEHGNTHAARHFSKILNVNLGESSVRVMKKAYLQLKSQNKTEEVRELVHKSCGRPLLLGELDYLVKEHVDAIRSEGGIVNRNIVIATARGVVLYENKSLLVENGGPIKLDRTWANSFLNRHNFVKRKATKAARKVPADFSVKKEEFIRTVGEIVNDSQIPADLIINFDQTGVKIVPVSSWTLATEGIKQVDVIAVDDKREITMLLGSTVSGSLLPPQIIYQGLTDKCHARYDFPEDWHVTHSPNHWSNEDTMLQYVDHVLVPYTKKIKKQLGLPVRQKSLLIFDVFAAHRCESFLEVLKKRHFVVRFVPAGCTGELQPMDLSVNNDFKVLMKEEFTTWYAEQVSKNLSCGDKKIIDLRISVMKPLNAKWIDFSVNKLSHRQDTIIRGWEKSGLLDVIGN